MKQSSLPSLFLKYHADDVVSRLRPYSTSWSWNSKNHKPCFQSSSGLIRSLTRVSADTQTSGLDSHFFATTHTSMLLYCVTSAPTAASVITIATWRGSNKSNLITSKTEQTAELQDPISATHHLSLRCERGLTWMTCNNCQHPEVPSLLKASLFFLVQDGGHGAISRQHSCVQGPLNPGSKCPGLKINVSSNEVCHC